MFVDTSAFYALLAANDQNHARAVPAWRSLMNQDALLETTNYVLLETSALVQRRLGMAALQELHRSIQPAVAVHWLGEPQHEAAMRFALAASLRDLSLVDCSSFVVMREAGITSAFCFDKHFAEQGFTAIPA